MSEDNTKQILKLANKLATESIEKDSMVYAQAAQAFVLIVIACELHNIVKELKDE